jgi:hypothetical protein
MTMVRERVGLRVPPHLTPHPGYAEVRRILHPRWYVAGRIGYLRANVFPGRKVYEGVAGFRPNTSNCSRSDIRFSKAR